MTHLDHVQLIKKAIPKDTGIWADLGSGTGAFTLALADLVSPETKIYSIDKDKSSLETQKTQFEKMFPDANVEFRIQDFTTPLNLPPLDGILMANSLHYVKDKIPFLKRLKTYLKPKGRLLLIEYNADSGNYWVPYPLSYDTFEKLMHASGFSKPTLLATISSSFLREIYSALAIG